MLGAKKITSSDITRAVVRRNFANGTTFDMYEHDISSDNTTTSGASIYTTQHFTFSHLIIEFIKF